MFYSIKEKSIGPPKIYLGGSVRKYCLTMELNAGRSVLLSTHKSWSRTSKNISASKLMISGTCQQRQKCHFSDFIPPCTWHFTKVAVNWGSILHVPDWHPQVACGTWTSWHLPRVLDDVNTWHCLGRALALSTPNDVCILDPRSDPVVEESSFERQDRTSSDKRRYLNLKELDS